MTTRLVRGDEVIDFELLADSANYRDRMIFVLERRDSIINLDGDRVPGEKREVVTGLELTTMTKDQYEGPSFSLKMGNGTVQRLMDTLWRLGARPSDFQDRRDEITALKAHLADMRMLALPASARAIERAMRE